MWSIHEGHEGARRKSFNTRIGRETVRFCPQPSCTSFSSGCKRLQAFTSVRKRLQAVASVSKCLQASASVHKCSQAFASVRKRLQVFASVRKRLQAVASVRKRFQALHKRSQAFQRILPAEPVCGAGGFSGGGRFVCIDFKYILFILFSSGADAGAGRKAMAGGAPRAGRWPRRPAYA